MSAEILVAYGVDVDAVGGWLGSYGGQDSPCDISRGMFAGEIGVPRLLELFRREGIDTTWFWPGHSVETFGEQFDACVAAGHEIGLHGYSHENPLSMTREQEAAILDRCLHLITERSGVRPTGYVAPWWEFSPHTAELLVERGIGYDHSLMQDDHRPHWVRVGDSWTKIDYTAPAESWMHPLRRGHETDLVEIPASWYLDDLPPMMFVKASPNTHGFVSPRDIETLWRDQFDWLHREAQHWGGEHGDGGPVIFPMTVHPDVSGRPQTLLMHERLIAHFRAHSGVRFVRFAEIADAFRARAGTPGR